MKKTKTNLFFCFALSLNSLHSWAEDFIHLEIAPSLQKTLSNADSKALQFFIKDTLKRLPSFIQKQISGTWPLQFVSIKSRTHQDQLKDIAPLKTPDCSVKNSDETNNFQFETYGVHSSGKIQLNEGFLQEIFKGPSRTRKYPCLHGNMYQLAQATLLHELAHILDKQLKKINKANSSSQEFTSLVDLRERRLGPRKRKNFYEERSPDPYEFESASESFAVNFEYFILDPEFACRRPTLHNYYAQTLGGSPYPRKRCQVNNNVLVWSMNSHSATAVEFSLKNLYRIEYLLAEPGGGLASRFGHAMLRLVFCSPTRDRVSAECLKDLNYHVVVSYAANVDDIILNQVKGFFGGYDSIQYFYRFPEILTQYSEVEMRGLYAFPLELNTIDTQNVLWRLLERHWYYSGHYKFPSENCATEVRDLLRFLLPEETQSGAHVISPRGLLSSLQDQKIILRSRKEIEKEALQYFPSKEENYENDFKKLLIKVPSLKNISSDYDDYRKSNPLLRRAFFQSINTDDPTIFTGLAMLEEQARIVENASVRKKIVKMTENASSLHSQELSTDIKTLAVLNRQLVTPAELFNLHQGYGIALNSEVDKTQIQPLFKKIQNLKKEIFKLKSGLSIDLRSDQIKENLVFLYDKILGADEFAIPSIKEIIDFK